MLDREKVESIKKIGSKMIYFELLIFYLAIFTVLYFEDMKRYSNTIMIWTVFIVLFSKISVLLARQKAILRLMSQK